MKYFHWIAHQLPNIAHQLLNTLSGAEFWKQKYFSIQKLSTRKYIRVDTVFWMLELCESLKEGIKENVMTTFTVQLYT
jgi:hypothetical protein